MAWGIGEEPPTKGDGKAILDYLQAKAPPVYDPFCGGGSIPLESQRLGLRAYGSDLNPVAVLISKALVEIPPKFAGKPPVNPGAQAELRRGGNWNGNGAQGVADDVRYYGNWMRDEAEKRIGYLYPKAILEDGAEATVIAWLWARTVRSPDPTARGAMVPLVGSFLLAGGKGTKTWVEIVQDLDSRDGWRFEIRSGFLTPDELEHKSDGTVGRKGAHCVLTGSPIPLSYIRLEGRAGRLADRLMGVIADGPKGRVYLAPNNEHEATARIGAQQSTQELGQDIPHNPRDIKPPTYGMKVWKDLFTQRQLVALQTLSELLSDVAERARGAASAAGHELGVGLASGGHDAVAYGEAIQTYLAFSLDKAANYWSNACAWNANREALISTFGRQAIAMVWDYCEANPFSSSTGNFLSGVDSSVKSLNAAPAISAGTVSQIDARIGPFPLGNFAVCTDPPYYDNIAYAELSDFFYVWLRHSLSATWNDLFRRLSTPKESELVAAPFRHGGREAADSHFINGISQCFHNMKSSCSDEHPMVIFYAFKQSKQTIEGIASAGWSTFLQGLIEGGYIIDGTWPIRTEYTGNLKKALNVLASSVVLVCRKRLGGAGVVTRAQFMRALKRELPDAIASIRKAGVGPVDMQQSVIGPGMGVFSRFAKVLEDNDSAMSVKTALSLINRVWEEIENELDTNFDAETQVALAWFATYGFDARPSGELIMLANAKTIPSNALFASGVFKDMKGKTALTPREELPKDWALTVEKVVTVWECVQHTARALNAEDGGAKAAAKLVAEMGPKAADARALAYRLYEIASNKGWAAEALIYNELAQEWLKLEDLAATDGARPVDNAQSSMF